MDHHVGTRSVALNGSNVVEPHFYANGIDNQITAYTGEDGYRSCGLSNPALCVIDDSTASAFKAPSFAHKAANAG